MTSYPDKDPLDLTKMEFLSVVASLPDDMLLAGHHASALVGIKERTLEEQRSKFARLKRTDPDAATAYFEQCVPWVPSGDKLVRYRLGDLRQYGRAARARIFAAPSPEIPAAPAEDVLINILARQMDGGVFPFALIAGEPKDFIATIGEDVDGIEWLLPEEVAALRATGARLAPQPAD